ncbi:MAG: CHAT domain-containing protein [Gammaproteobacteria bacterium]|nr:CHAT domain-containing protein [Gammaproteobacteria bacterium]
MIISGRVCNKRYWLAIALACLPSVLLAEISTDGSLGAQLSLDGPRFRIDADLGRQMGGNLFHSFSRFNLSAGESAVFFGPNNVSVVISRVTGGAASHIDGTLASEIPAADLYFLNPAGILFGPQARLNVPGSVYLSTAARLELGETGVFDAREPEASVLSIAAPEAFRFDAASAAIETDGSLLEVPAGHALSFDSAGLRARNSVFRAPGGTLSINTRNGDFKLSHSAETPRPLDAPANLDAGGGRVLIRGNGFYLENARISARLKTGESSETPGGVHIDVSAAAELNGGTISTGSDPGVVQKAGDIALSATQIILRKNAQIISNGAGGDGGDIRLQADKAVLDESRLRAEANSTRSQTRGGNIFIRAREFSLKNKGAVSTLSSGSGNAGNIEIHADTVSITEQSGISALAYFAQGGNIDLDVFTRLLLTDSDISSSARGRESRDGGGNIDVRDTRFTVLRNAAIKADANHGNGGNIHLGGDYLLMDNSILDASSKLGADGQVIAEPPIPDFGGSLLIPSPTRLNTPRLGRGCAERLGKNSSELKMTPYAMLPVSPWGMREVWPRFAPGDAAAAYYTGDYRRAAELWRRERKTLPKGSKRWLDTGLGLVAAYRHLGLAHEALALALALAEMLWHGAAGLPEQRVYAGIMLSALLVRREEAGVFTRIFESARGLDDLELQAGVLNMRGSRLHAQARHQSALALYRKAYALSPKNSPTAFKALLNALQAATEMSSQRQAREFVRENLPAARAFAEHLPDSYETAMDLLAFVKLQDKLADKTGQRPILAKVRRIAEILGHPRLLSWVYGELGQRDDKLEYTRQAIFFAQEAGAPELLYLWHAQLGFLLARQGQVKTAVDEYRQAVAALRPIRALLLSSLGWRKADDLLHISQTYRRAIDYSLRHARTLNGTARQEALTQTLAVAEQYKQFEIENYFQDECLTLLRQNSDSELPPRTAVLYPLIFGDRIDLVLRLKKRILLQTAARAKITHKKLERILSKWRRTYDPVNGRKLYELLIQPVAASLASARIDTLVIVPDGLLYSLPFSALHDGTRYLLEKPYATVVTPALSLTSFARRELFAKHALLAGISNKTGGFPGLPYTRRELNASATTLDGYAATFILDDFLTKQAFKDELRARYYPLVHLATHARFDDNISHSFLLLNDGRLSFNELETFLRPFGSYPLELMVLSACTTAIGKNDRSALGLAGIAVKTGVRSVIGSLWQVDDAATAKLIPAFYKHWLPAGSKVKALQLAQRTLLTDKNYHSPKYWAAFILAGNWL